MIRFVSMSEARGWKRRSSLLVALCLVSLFAVGGCSWVTRPTAQGASTVRVGIATNYAPLAFAQNGRITGVEADFAHRLPSELGTQVTIVETPWEEMIQALLDRRIDVIMSGMSVTEERKKVISFTDPYLRVGQMALVRKADYERLRDPAAMDRPISRVGFLKATTGEYFARANLAHAKLRAFDSVDEGVAALRARDLDFFIHDAPTIWRITGGFSSPERELTGIYQLLTEEYLAWAVRKEDEALRQRLNAILQRWKDNGEIESVLDKWITVRKESISVKPH